MRDGMIRGGSGSHWDGCEGFHWDCKIAKLDKEVESLRLMAQGATLFFAVLVKSLGGEVKMLQKDVMDFEGYVIQRIDNDSDMSYTFRVVEKSPPPD